MKKVEFQQTNSIKSATSEQKTKAKVADVPQTLNIISSLATNVLHKKNVMRVDAKASERRVILETEEQTSFLFRILAVFPLSSANLTPGRFYPSQKAARAFPQNGEQMGDLEKFPYEVHQCVKANTPDASERPDQTSVL